MKMPPLLSLLSLLLIVSNATLAKEFTLKNGSKITGEVLSESDTHYQIKTPYGLLNIAKTAVSYPLYQVTMQSGDIIRGQLLSDNDQHMVLKSQYGTVTLQKTDISQFKELAKYGSPSPSAITTITNGQTGQLSFIDRLSQHAQLVQPEKLRHFTFSDERLIDLFFDPTAYTLKEGTLYMSGFSFGAGVTDKFHLMSNWGNMLDGNVNLRGKYQIYQRGNWKKESALAVGAHLHTNWIPNRYEWRSSSATQKTLTNDYCYTDAKAGETVYWDGFYPIGTTFSVTERTNSGLKEGTTCSYIDIEQNLNRQPALELFSAWTLSKARANKKGRYSHTAGLSLLQGENTELFTRAYWGFDIDISARLKLLLEVFYDPAFNSGQGLFNSGFFNDYYAEAQSTQPQKNNEESSGDINFDFGFIYAYNESFRFGFHSQAPFIAIYWKL